MAARTRASLVLLRTDGTSGNWTVAPSPEPSPLQSSRHGPPYATNQALVGGTPTLLTDVPVAATLLALFAASAAAHMAVLSTNRRRGSKFLFSGMLFALCLLRSGALGTRIAWAADPGDADVGAAAGILTQVGSVLVFIVNAVLAQRVLRAYHPRVGWHPLTTFVFRFVVACVVASLIMAVAVTIQALFTLDRGIRNADRIVQLFAATYMAFVAFVPFPVVALAALLYRARARRDSAAAAKGGGNHGRGRVEKFGAGRWRSKVALLLCTSALATAGAAFRVFTGFAPRPASDPAWYHGRACYYCFNFATDLLISTLYLFSRFDRRFVVPDGSKGPGDYGKGTLRAGAGGRRPPSVATSEEDGAGEDKGNDDSDPEKLARLRADSNGDSNSNGNGEDVYGEKPKSKPPSPALLPPMYDDDEVKGMGKGKGKGRDIDDNDEKKDMSPASPPVDNSTQTPAPGTEWYPWPFRGSWQAMPPRNKNRPSALVPVSRSSSTKHSSEGDSPDAESAPVNYSPVDGASRAGTEEEASSQWGGGTSTTYIQEPDAVHHHHAQRKQRRQFHPHQFQPHAPGQAYTSDQALHMDAVASPSAMSETISTTNTIAPSVATAFWPLTSEPHSSGRDPVVVSSGGPSRSRSVATYCAPSSSNSSGSGGGRMPSRGVVSRSRSSRTVDVYSEPEGGWI